MISPRALCVVVVLVVSSLTPAAADASAPLFGFSDNAVRWRQVTAPQDARLAGQAGATTSRIAVDWSYVQPTPDYWIWSDYDAIYNADIAAGIRPIFELGMPPAWALADGQTCPDSNCAYPPGPEHLDDWGTFAAAVAMRYPQLAAIEVWNEPNLSRYWAPAPDPERYAALVRATHDAVTGAGSSVPVLGGALSNDPLYNTTEKITARIFLGRMYAAGFKGAADGISVHAYPNDIDEWLFFKTLTELRDVRDYNTDTVPLWITEIGTSTTGASPASLGDYGQAVLLPRLYGLLGAMPDVRAMTIHTLIDPTRYPASSLESGLGLMDSSLNPKPSYCAFAAVNGTGYVCPPTVTQPAANPDQDRRWEAQELVQRAADAARAYRKTTGSYSGVNSVALHAIDPAISAVPANGAQAPGPSADPSRMLVNVTTYTSGVGSTKVLLVCDASRSSRSYCIRNAETWPFVYGQVTGTIAAAASATNQGNTNSW